MHLMTKAVENSFDQSSEEEDECCFEESRNHLTSSSSSGSVSEGGHPVQSSIFLASRASRLEMRDTQELQAYRRLIEQFNR